MDIASIVGTLLGVGLLGGAMFMAAGQSGLSIALYADLNSAIIVLGGSLAATAIAFPLPKVISVFKLMGMVFQKPPWEPKELAQKIIDLSAVARKNTKDLQGEMDGIRNWFLKDGVQFIIDGVNPDDIKDMMELREATRDDKEASEANVMKKMGDYSPAFGMVGTLIGLVIMMFSMGAGGGDDGGEGGDMAAKLGLSMGVALITTFYGALFANLIFLPFAEKLNQKNEENKKVQALIIEGVALLAKKQHPIMVTEKLNSYLQPADRIRQE